MEPKVVPLHLLKTHSPIEWNGVRAPQRDWMINNVVLRRTACLFSGVGGIGKSLLMLQLMTAMALGRPWLGMDVPSVRSFAVFAEDPLDEVHRRQDDISEAYQINHGDLDAIDFMCLEDLPDPSLYQVTGKSQAGEPTRLWKQIVSHVMDTGAQFVILDNAGACFTANENFKEHVRPFGQMLNKLAVDIDGAVVLIQHPSKDGENDKYAQSGSRMWRNAVRSQLILHLPKEDGESDEPSNERVLRVGKHNYGPAQRPLRIVWDKGIFIPVDAPQIRSFNQYDAIELRASITAAMRRLIPNGTQFSLANGSKVHVATQLKKSSEWNRYAWRDICAAAETMLADGKLVRVPMGPPSRRQVYVRPTDVIYPGESVGQSEEST